jgi:Protein of unknown function (DUF2778)
LSRRPSVEQALNNVAPTVACRISPIATSGASATDPGSASPRRKRNPLPRTGIFSRTRGERSSPADDSLPQLLGFLVSGIRGTRRAGGPACTGQPRLIRDWGALIHTGLRSTSAWIGALVFGFALGLVVTYGLADTGRRPVGARLSDVAAPKDIDFQRAQGSQIPNNSGMRLASLEMPVSSGYAVADTEAPALTRPRASTADRLLPADFPASIEARFVGAAASSNTASAGSADIEERADSALPSSPNLPEKSAPPVISRPAPKPAPSSPRRIRTADLSPDTSSLQADNQTAIYDIAARTVYLPNGRRLEAHSGLGDLMDDPRDINVKARGPTPPNVYNLTLREELFHGVRAIRLNPVDESKMFGRDGILAHTYMLGPNGQSNGCVSFSDYTAFVNAYLHGEVTRMVVVEHLANTPTPQTATQWFADTLKDLFSRS